MKAAYALRATRGRPAERPVEVPLRLAQQPHRPDHGDGAPERRERERIDVQVAPPAARVDCPEAGSGGQQQQPAHSHLATPPPTVSGGHRTRSKTANGTPSRSSRSRAYRTGPLPSSEPG